MHGGLDLEEVLDHILEVVCPIPPAQHSPVRYDLMHSPSTWFSVTGAMTGSSFTESERVSFVARSAGQGGEATICITWECDVM